MAETPTCPRCGYDQQGVIDSWKTQCPLTGICSECGHPFRWAEILDPRAQLVRWFVEHPFPGRNILRRIAATWLWTLLPWIFWDRVGVKQPASKWRMLLCLALPLASIQFIAGIARSVTIWQFWPSSRYWDALDLHLVIAWFGPIVDIAVRGTTLTVAPVPTNWPYPITVLVAISLGMPLSLILLSGTRKACRLRLAHVWRAMVYGLIWLIVPAIARAASYIDTLFDVFPAPMGSAYYFLNRGQNWIDVEFHEHQWRWGSALIVWSMVWWWCVIDRGFRLADAGIIWSLLMTACLLLAGVLLITNPAFLLQYFG